MATTPDLIDWLWMSVPAGVHILGWYFWNKRSRPLSLRKSRRVVSLLGAVSFWISETTLILSVVLMDRNSSLNYFYRVGIPLLKIGFLSAVASVIALWFAKGWSRVCFLVASLVVLIFWLGVANSM